MEHGRVLHRVYLRFFARGTVHQHRQAFVDRRGEFGIAACSKDRGGAGVRVDAGEIPGRQRKAADRIPEFGHILEKEGASRGFRQRSRAYDQRTKLEATVHVGKEGPRIETRAPVLEVIQRFQSAFRRNALEEPRRRLVRGNARGHQKPHHPVGFHQGQRAFDKQRIKVQVTGREQRIVARPPRHPHRGRRPFARQREVPRQRIVRFLQFGDHPLAVGGAWGHGDVRAPGREPLDLLQFHPVPGRIADDRVEAAIQLARFPIRPYARERHLPVQEALAGDKRTRVVEQPGEPFRVFIVFHTG